jgi:signal transduction histidine kinase
MSHELRTPLGVVLGHSALLRDMAPENLRVDLDVIAKSAMRLKEIIEDFSNVDRIEAGLASLRRQRVMISTLVQSVVDSFKDLARDHQIALDFHVSQRNLALEGDESKIAIALSNLVRNALTFTNPGGQVQVRAEQVPGYIKIAVIDDGIGIPAAEQEKIFERFYQVEKHLTRRHGGMGLGLSIAREFIELHGGRIWVESTEGKGSRFTFLLPKSQAEAAAAGRVFGS